MRGVLPPCVTVGLRQLVQESRCMGAVPPRTHRVLSFNICAIVKQHPNDGLVTLAGSYNKRCGVWNSALSLWCIGGKGGGLRARRASAPQHRTIAKTARSRRTLSRASISDPLSSSCLQQLTCPIHAATWSAVLSHCRTTASGPLKTGCFERADRLSENLFAHCRG